MRGIVGPSPREGFLECSDPLAWIRAVSPRAMIVSAINGITTYFTFLSKRGRAEERTPLDSGMTENFMDQSMVKHLGIGMRKLAIPRRIFNVDGMENIARRLTECCTLRVRKGD